MLLGFALQDRTNGADVILSGYSYERHCSLFILSYQLKKYQSIALITYGVIWKIVWGKDLRFCWSKACDSFIHVKIRSMHVVVIHTVNAADVIHSPADVLPFLFRCRDAKPHLQCCSQALSKESCLNVCVHHLGCENFRSSHTDKVKVFFKSYCTRQFLLSAGHQSKEFESSKQKWVMLLHSVQHWSAFYFHHQALGPSQSVWRLCHFKIWCIKVTACDVKNKKQKEQMVQWHWLTKCKMWLRVFLSYASTPLASSVSVWGH